MAQVFQWAIGLGSGAFFFVLLQRAFFPREPHPESNWFGPVDVGVALTLSVLFAWVAIGLFSVPEKPFSEDSISSSVVMDLVLVGVILGYVALRKIPLGDFFDLSARPFWKPILLGVALTVGIFTFVATLTSLLNPDPSGEQAVVRFFRESTSLQARLLLGFMAVVIAPIAEELVFRGLLYRIFKGYFGKIFAMFFTSVLFAAIHGNLPTLLPLTLLAFALTAGLEISGSLLVSIAMHATFNGISLLFLLNDSAR